MPNGGEGKNPTVRQEQAVPAWQRHGAGRRGERSDDRQVAEVVEAVSVGGVARAGEVSGADAEQRQAIGAATVVVYAHAQMRGEGASAHKRWRRHGHRP